MSALAHEPVEGLGRWLSVAVAVGGALALAGLVVPGQVGLDLATAAVIVVVAAPLGRVIWLVGAWGRAGDRLFVAVGVGLVTVVAAGATLAVLT